MAQGVVLAETRLCREEVLLVASLGDIALKRQAGIGKILYFLARFPDIPYKERTDQDCGLLSLKRGDVLLPCDGFAAYWKRTGDCGAS